MTPLELDKYVRCVKRNGGEEWFAYSTGASIWIPMPSDKICDIVAPLLGLLLRIKSCDPSYGTETVLNWCRANCYSNVGYDSVMKEVLFEKRNTDGNETD